MNIALSWRHHQVGTFSALLALCAGNLRVTDEFPSQRPVMRGFDGFFDLCQNTRLNNKSRRRWFETMSRSLWRHCNDDESVMCITTLQHHLSVWVHWVWNIQHMLWTKYIYHQGPSVQELKVTGCEWYRMLWNSWWHTKSFFLPVLILYNDIRRYFETRHFWWHWQFSYNWPNSQIPECTCSISHNAPFRTEMCTFLHRMWAVQVIWMHQQWQQ